MNIGSWIISAVILAVGLTLGALDIARPSRSYETSSAFLTLTANFEPESSNPSTGLAKYEPLDGCYLGAYIDLDPQLKASFTDEYGTKRKRPEDFEKAIGQKHSMYFFYMGYGRPVAMDYLRFLSSEGKYVQIALEPNNGLDSVSDNETLWQLADDLRDCGAKVFLRFASEMNGDWVAYHGDPEKYIEKWRLVTRVMRERAPNVAMVWCPYALPLGNIQDYYPGDEWVDWVGVNMYNVTFFNQDTNSPAKEVGPKALLEPVYEKFAWRKPIMICEYATTHFSAVEKKSVSYFAANNIMELYGSLQKEFPRVKAIYYFSSNNLSLAHRRNNNYSLLEDPVVLEAYRKSIADKYFISDPNESRQAEPVSVSLKPYMKITDITRISAWAQADKTVGIIRFSVNGKPVFTATNVRDWSFVLDPAAHGTGRCVVGAEAFSSTGEKLAEQEVPVVIEPAVSN